MLKTPEIQSYVSILDKTRQAVIARDKALPQISSLFVLIQLSVGIVPRIAIKLAGYENPGY